MGAKTRLMNVGSEGLVYTHGGKQYIIPPKNGKWEMREQVGHREVNGKFFATRSFVLTNVDPTAENQPNWCDVPVDLATRLLRGSLRDTHFKRPREGAEPIHIIVPQEDYEATLRAEDAARVEEIRRHRQKLDELAEQEALLAARVKAAEERLALAAAASAPKPEAKPEEKKK